MLVGEAKRFVPMGNKNVIKFLIYKLQKIIINDCVIAFGDYKSLYALE